MKLYEINNAIAELLEQVDPDTGELMCDFDALEELNLAREEKIENLACYIKNLAAEAAAIKAEEDNLAARRKTIENGLKNAKEYLASQLNGEKFETARVKIGWRKSAAVQLADGFMKWAVENDKFLRYETPKPDKKAIADALKAGEEIPGAELVTNISMNIK